MALVRHSTCSATIASGPATRVRVNEEQSLRVELEAAKQRCRKLLASPPPPPATPAITRTQSPLPQPVQSPQPSPSQLLAPPTPGHVAEAWAGDAPHSLHGQPPPGYIHARSPAMLHAAPAPHATWPGCAHVCILAAAARVGCAVRLQPTPRPRVPAWAARGAVTATAVATALAAATVIEFA